MLSDSALKNDRINKLVLDTQNPIKFLTPNTILAHAFSLQTPAIGACPASLEREAHQDALGKTPPAGHERPPGNDGLLALAFAYTGRRSPGAALGRGG
jgi:hypothetical protein